jgi:hypothetical protein
VVGFGVWRKALDLFWSTFGGDGLGLYVIPSHRGRGVAVCIVAAMCAEIREQGGHFLQTSCDADLWSLYERVGVGETRARLSCLGTRVRSPRLRSWKVRPLDRPCATRQNAQLYSGGCLNQPPEDSQALRSGQLPLDLLTSYGFDLSARLGKVLVGQQDFSDLPTVKAVFAVLPRQ